MLSDSLTVGYALEGAPTLADAEAELGPARELPRGFGPFQLAFTAPPGQFIAATTEDPPGTDPRRLTELTVRRDA
ncbi:MAG: hypothetical protein ABWZ03_05340 [Solirubrobacterales bacterium]